MVATTTKKENTMAGVQAGLNSLLGVIEQEITEKMDAEVKKVNDKLHKVVKETDEKILNGVQLTVTYEDKQNKIAGTKHKKFVELLTVVGQRIPVMLVGSAGTGKTYGAKQVSEALGIPFYAISVGAQTSKTDLLGYMNANGTYVSTAFRDAWENGGVYVMDEIDAGNSNVTITLNSALSSDYCAFPDGMVTRHKNFMFIATANTFGHGASRQYVGRNQLDAATLDRFVTIDWDLDESLEEKLVHPYTYGKAWLQVVKRMREYSESSGIRMLITPRASIHGSKMLEQNMKPSFVIGSTILSSAPDKSKSDLESVANKAWTTAFDLHKEETTKAKENNKLEV